MKYTVKMSCGHEDVVDLTGRGEDRERRIHYLEQHGLCKECYLNQKRAEEKAAGLQFCYFHINKIDEETGSPMIMVWFSGDTMPYKDQLKELGYRWNDITYWVGIYCDRHMAWSLLIDSDLLNDQADQARALGAKVIGPKSLGPEAYALDIRNYRISLNRQKEWTEISEKRNSIPKPHAPEILNGRRWNKKIYGRSGSMAIYLDGEKIEISDEQASVLDNYLKALDQYRDAISQIK